MPSVGRLSNCIGKLNKQPDWREANVANKEFNESHIACALLFWCRFKELRYETEKTVYQIKFGQLSDYLIKQLKNPSVKIKFV